MNSILEAVVGPKLHLSSHQTRFVANVISDDSARVSLLLAAPGMGKTTVAAALIATIALSKKASRILVVMPSILMDQIREMLLRFGEGMPDIIDLDRKKLRLYQSESGELRLPKRSIVTIGSSYIHDVILRSEVQRNTWDLCVIEGIQNVSEIGHFVRDLTERGSIRKTVCFFDSLRGAVKPQFFGESVSVENWNPKNYGAMLDTPYAPIIRVGQLTYRRTEPEQQIYKEVSKLAESVSDSTWVRGLHSTASSSLASLDRFLRSAKKRHLDNVAAPGYTYFLNALPDEQSAEIASEPEDADAGLLLDELIRRIEDCSTDSKADALVEVCRNALDANKDGRVVVFSRYPSTTRYLTAYLADEFACVRPLDRLKDGITDDVERDTKWAEILVVSDDKVHGLEIRNVHTVVNADHGRNSAIFLSRLLRTLRGSAKGEVTFYHVEDESPCFPFEKKVMRRRLSGLTQTLHE
jgi:hypothetical protein